MQGATQWKQFSGSSAGHNYPHTQCSGSAIALASQTSVPFMEEGLDTPERAALRDADAARSYGGGSSAAEIETNA